MKKITIHQPDFAPYLGFFHRLLHADQFIILDDAQYIKGGWQNRDRIKTKYGSAWLTLSITKKFPQQINQVLLDPKLEWLEDNLNLLREAYRQAPYFNEVFERIENIYYFRYEKMIDLNMAMMRLALEYLDIDIPISFSSSDNIDARNNARLIDIVNSAGGDIYLTGNGSREYLNEEMFDKAGIKVEWQSFQHPEYPQLHGEFEPMLSCLDILFNCGCDAAYILRNNA